MTDKAMNIIKIMIIIVGTIIIIIMFGIIFYFNAFGLVQNINEKIELTKAIALLIGSILLIIQINILNKRANAQEKLAKSHENQIEVISEQNNNILYNTAIKNLGNQSESVRLGGIYALYELAQVNKYRESIFEILCAHVRSTTSQEEYQEKYKKKPSNEIQSVLEILTKKNKFLDMSPKLNLSNSFLRGANLFKAYLFRSRLFNIDLTGSRLDGANLCFSTLEYICLDRASLTSANLYRSYITGASFIDSNLSGAYLIDTRFCKTRFYEADLKNAFLQGSYLASIELQGADLSGTNLQASYLVGARLETSIMNKTRLEGAYLNYACLADINFSNDSFSNDSFSDDSYFDDSYFDDSFSDDSYFEGVTSESKDIFADKAFVNVENRMKKRVDINEPLNHALFTMLHTPLNLILYERIMEVYQKNLISEAFYNKISDLYKTKNTNNLPNLPNLRKEIKHGVLTKEKADTIISEYKNIKKKIEKESLAENWQ